MSLLKTRFDQCLFNPFVYSRYLSIAEHGNSSCIYWILAWRMKSFNNNTTLVLAGSQKHMQARPALSGTVLFCHHHHQTGKLMTFNSVEACPQWRALDSSQQKGRNKNLCAKCTQSIESRRDDSTHRSKDSEVSGGESKRRAWNNLRVTFFFFSRSSAQ